MCVQACVFMHVKTKGQCHSLRGHLWDKFSHWDLKLVNWLDWLITEPQGSSCILFPAWDYKCMGIKTKSLCLRDKHFINWAISPTPRTLDFLKPYRCAPDFYMTCKALTAYPTIFLKIVAFIYFLCMCAAVKGHHGGMSSLFPTCGSKGSNSGHQT